MNKLSRRIFLFTLSVGLCVLGVNGLRLLNGVSINQLSKYTERDIYKVLEPKIEKWDGLTIENEQLILDNKSIMLTDEIASDLFLE